MSDEETRAATVGEPDVHDGPIVLSEYDPTWPLIFALEEERIRAALGDRVLGLDHVGSTSVPGLAAKPVIDINLVVEDSSSEAAYVPALETAGYILRICEPNWFEHRMFDRTDVSVHLHVFSSDCPEIERSLLFRDRLRTDSADRELYERTKRTSPRAPGGTSRTTQTPRATSSRRSSLAPEASHLLSRLRPMSATQPQHET